MITHEVENVGNRFLLADVRETGPHLWPRVATEILWGPDTERALYDGLLVLEGGPATRLRMFNPDGTEDFCGNGLLCAASYAWTTHLTNHEEFDLQHFGRTVPITLLINNDQVASVSSMLPPPRFDSAAIPMTAPHDSSEQAVLEIEGIPYPVYPVSVGTPHAILVVEELPDDETFFYYSPLLENHEVFPERITVDWVRALGPNMASVRIWERGVGETLGCGTGSAAIAATTFGIVHDGLLSVLSKGGEIQAEWPGDGPIQITGQPKVSLEPRD